MTNSTLWQAKAKSFLLKIAPHIAAYAIIFSVLAICFPNEFQHKAVVQGDIMFYKSGARELHAYSNQDETPPRWTNTMFSGMPVYPAVSTATAFFDKRTLFQFGFYRMFDLYGLIFKVFPVASWSVFTKLLHLALGCYILMMVFRIRWYFAVIAALAFSLSTSYLLALEAGHNLKIVVMSYTPLIVSGVVLLFRKRYFLGALFSFLALSESIYYFHPQITYYTMFIVLAFLCAYAWKAYKKRDFKPFLISALLLVISYGLAIGINSYSLVPTYQYTKHSIRGGSELTKDAKQQPSTGLGKDYITHWSLGKWETFTSIVPHFMGGGTEDLGTKSHLYKKLTTLTTPSEAKRYVERIPTYWGDQPFVSGPIYVGASIFFMACLAFLVLKGIYKRVLIAVMMIGLVFAWGKNLPWIVDMLIDYMPYYNKFRAVTMAFGITAFALPVFALLGIHRFFEKKDAETLPSPHHTKQIWKALYISGGTVLFLLLIGNFFDMTSQSDAFFQKNNLLDALKQDRLEMFRSSALRSLLFIALTFAICWAYLNKKIHKGVFVLGLTLIVIFDLQLINNRYFNEENYKSHTDKTIKNPFPPTAADLQIQKDTNIYRVYNTLKSPMSDGVTPKNHFSIGGYSAAKMRRYQELYEHHIEKGNIGVINMLNVKYFIVRGKDQGKPTMMKNPSALGNAWLVSGMQWADDANQEIQKLGDIDTRHEIVVNQVFKNSITPFSGDVDTTASVYLDNYHPDTMRYHYSSMRPSVVVFSEIYYPEWQAYIDGNPVDHFRCNYVLRGLQVPAGQHELKFIYQARAEKEGAFLSRVFSWVSLLFFLLFGGISLFLKWKPSKL